MYPKDCKGWENLRRITTSVVLFQTKTRWILLPWSRLNQRNDYSIWFRFDIFREKCPVLDQNGKFLHFSSDVTYPIQNHLS